ncbi:unnamed protein product, partial [Staurois parvus]
MTSVWTVLIGPVLITCTLPRKKTSCKTEHVQNGYGSVCLIRRFDQEEEQRRQDQTA